VLKEHSYNRLFITLMALSLVFPSILSPMNVARAEKIDEPHYTSSGSEDPKWGPEKAFDGQYNRYKDKDSRWASDASLATDENPKWLQVEYPEKKTFEGFKIHWERANVNAYSIQVSDDGEDFETLYESNENKHQWIETIKLDEAINAKFVKLVITDFDENSPTVDEQVSWPTVSVYEFEVLESVDNVVKGTENMAEGKTATASNEEANTDFVADNTVDGDFTTYWATDVSEEIETRTLDIDLHELTEVQSIIINWEREESNINAFNLSYSEDGEQYFPYFEQTEKSNIQRQVLNLENAVNARYLRLDVAEYDGGENDWPNVGIYEVEVFSDATTEEVDEIDSLSQLSQLTIDEENAKLDLPKAKSGELSVVGSNGLPVIDLDGNVTSPLIDKEVKVTLELTKENGNDETKEFSVPVKGIYSDDGVNEKPEVIPALQEWYGLEGSMTIDDSTSLVVQNSSFEKAAKIFQEDLVDSQNMKLPIQAADSNAIIFKQDEEGIYGEEGYGIEINNGNIEIIAEEYTGAFYATRTLLQILKTSDSNEVRNGLIRDYPKYKVRGFMLDVGRKFTDLDYLYDYMKNMSYYKMNDFQVHLNDNELEMDLFDSIEDAIENGHAGFRMESDIVGENGVPLTSEDVYYTKDEFHQFISDASDYGMEIVPEFDTPGHALSMVKVRPDLYYKGEIINGKPQEEAAAMLDLSHPDTLPFIKSIYDEYLDGENPVFQDSTIHIGSDEYYGGAEKYRAYVDDMLKFIRDEKDRTVRLWGSLTNKAGETPVTSEDVQIQVWNTGWANPDQMLDEGFDIINIDDAQVYMVPRADYYHDRLNPENLYNNYQPNKFSNGTVVDESNPQFLGGMFALWNDKVGKLENGITQYDMFDRTFEAIPTMAQKTWGSSTDTSYEDFAEIAEKTGYAHNTNPTFDIETVDSTVVDYDFTKNSKDNSENGYDVEEKINAEVDEGEGLKLLGDESYVTTGLSELGPDATMEVTLTLEDTDDVQVIAEKNNDATYAEQSFQNYATIYAVDEDGYVGYDFGNLSYSFDYKLTPNEETTLTFVTELEKTRLFVDGEEVPLLEETSMPYNTLVLPLERIGSATDSLNGVISSFNVTKGKYVDPTIIDPGTMNISASSEELEQGDQSVEGPIELAFDGSLDTIWHSKWNDNSPFPIEVNLELEEETDLSKFVYTPRQSGDDNGHIKQYRLEVSMDGDDYEEVAAGTWKANSNPETIDLKGTTAKYVKFIVEDGQNGFASASQFSLHKALDPGSEVPEPASDISDLKDLVERYEETGDISSDEAIHALNLHLKALAQFEKSGDNKKVVKHLEGFKNLLDYYKEEGQISSEAYENLINGADMLIDELSN